ncbi:MAG: hypothetical protein KDC24_08870 [Saprospiraceae bacterium]|nr:hypothetical protein [Saprospiraceae bacterium]
MKYFFQCLTILAVTFMGCQSNEPSEPVVPQVVKVSNDKVTFDDGSELALPAGETVLLAVSHGASDFNTAQPTFNEEGVKQAARLDSLLGAVTFKSILSTTSNLSTETIKELNADKQLPIFTFDSGSVSNMSRFLFELEKGNKFLMVGDPTTLGNVLNQFDSSFEAASINKKNYSGFYIVTGSGLGACKVYPYRY